MNEFSAADDQCAVGREIMAGKTVTICGLARDCARSLRRLIPQVERLGSAFKSHRIIVVENDSGDETADVVANWKRQNPSVHDVRFCYVEPRRENATGWFGENRISRISFARNLYLELIQRQAATDFVIVIDLDIRSFGIEGIEMSFSLLEQWDVVTANGTRYSRRHPFRKSVYWDSYAYEPEAGFAQGVQTPRQIRDNQCRLSDELKNSTLVRARSAFGGLGIYRAEFLVGHRYCALDNEDPAVPVLSEHHGLHRSIRKKHQGLRLMIHSDLGVDYGSLAHLAGYTLRNLFSN